MQQPLPKNPTSAGMPTSETIAWKNGKRDPREPGKLDGNLVKMKRKMDYPARLMSGWLVTNRLADRCRRALPLWLNAHNKTWNQPNGRDEIWYQNDLLAFANDADAVQWEFIAAFINGNVGQENSILLKSGMSGENEPAGYWRFVLFQYICKGDIVRNLMKLDGWTLMWR